LEIVRGPKGMEAGFFYMKHSSVWAPEPLRRVNIREKKKVGEYLVADSPEAVIALAQMDVLEIHTWNSTDGNVERPDRIVMDIDPGEQVGWAEVVECARLLRSIFERLDLESYVKTTGGSGLHVAVPLQPALDWSECLALAKGVAERLVGLDPSRFTTSFPKAGRTRKILIDYLRNNRTNTSVAAYSSRARPGATVSVPLGWRELSPAKPPSLFTVRTVPRRLEKLAKDPWADYWRRPQRISRSAIKAVSG
ncbi:MAG: DNA ligase D, partial [Acidobacteria bacterium]